MTGYVVERNALPNMYVQPDTRLFTITDLSKVWIYAAVFQNEIGKVKSAIRYPLPSTRIRARTSMVGSISSSRDRSDDSHREGPMRVQQPQGQLLPGMFVRVALDLPMGEQTVIPDTGVLRTGEHNVAFIDRGDGYLTPAEIELGRTSATNSSCSRVSRRVSRSSAPPTS